MASPIYYESYLSWQSFHKMSRKAYLNDSFFDPVPMKGPILTKHARERCKQRHINPLHIGVNPSTNARFSRRTRRNRSVVATVYKNPPTEFVRVPKQYRVDENIESTLGRRQTCKNYKGPVISGEEYMRRAHRAVRVPMDVAVHVKKTKSHCQSEPRIFDKAEAKGAAKMRKHRKKQIRLTHSAKKRMEKRRSLKGLKNRL